MPGLRHGDFLFRRVPCFCITIRSPAYTPAPVLGLLWPTTAFAKLYANYGRCSAEWQNKHFACAYPADCQSYDCFSKPAWRILPGLFRPSLLPIWAVLHCEMASFAFRFGSFPLPCRHNDSRFRPFRLCFLGCKSDFSALSCCCEVCRRQFCFVKIFYLCLHLYSICSFLPSFEAVVRASVFNGFTFAQSVFSVSIAS